MLPQRIISTTDKEGVLRVRHIYTMKPPKPHKYELFGVAFEAPIIALGHEVVDTPNGPTLGRIFGGLPATTYIATYKCTRCKHQWVTSTKDIQPLNHVDCTLGCSKIPDLVMIIGRVLNRERDILGTGLGRLIKLETHEYEFEGKCENLAQNISKGGER